ncbi:hypothetical protein WM40_17380 [Robbsia andropogonis]|uniref:DUF7079 domain-containing protein n=1 Tax=Robbsia andropogonis TaxID=28092 RepID=A0A0F5JXH9_9BURK|nr:hypothetical protein WM40_17380 [Robbsia andropogonis]
MADQLDSEERFVCWYAMSEAFVDNEVDYDAIGHTLVESCPSYSDMQLKEIFFSEVAPVVGGNVFGAAGVWTGFDPTWLRKEISERLRKRQESSVEFVRTSFGNLCSKVFLRTFWKDIEAAIARKRAELGISSP